MADWDLRVRAALDRHGRTVAAALLVLAVAGGWLTYGAYAAPETTADAPAGPSWEASGAFDHGATVAEENPLYPAGTALRNRSTYFVRIAPVLNGTYAFEYAAPGGGDLDVAVDARFVLESVGDGNETHWRTARPVANRTATGVAPGESVSVPFSADVAAAANRSERIDERLGGSPGETRAAVRVTVDVAGTVGGERVEETLRYALPIEFESAAYRVGGGDSTDQFAAAAPVGSSREPGPLGAVGGPALLFVGAFGLLGVGYASRRRSGPALSEAERAELAFRRDREAFDDWIVTVDLPAAALDRPGAAAESLADLVDLAVDAGASVIESPGGGAYYVLRDGVAYTYEPPAVDGDRATPASTAPDPAAPAGRSDPSTAPARRAEQTDGGDAARAPAPRDDRDPSEGDPGGADRPS